MKLFVCKNGGLFEAVLAKQNLAINVAVFINFVVYVVCCLIFLTKIFAMDSHVFTIANREWGHEKEIFYVKLNETGSVRCI